MAWAAEEERATARKMTTAALENMFIGLVSNRVNFGKGWVVMKGLQ